MRAAPYPPDEMPADLRAQHDEMAAYVAEHLKGFVSMRTDGALVGPFPPMLRFPAFGRAAWSYTKALIDHSCSATRRMAGARHERMAGRVGRREGVARL